MLKSTFQIKAFASARELGERLYLTPTPLASKNGIQFDNYLNLTVFTIYDDRLDKGNEPYVEVALGDHAISKECRIEQNAVLDWFREFTLKNAREAKPKSPEFWRRVALRNEKEVSAFCSSLSAFLTNPPRPIEDNKSKFDANPKSNWKSNPTEQMESGQNEIPVDEVTYRSIKTRRGQAEFRKALLVTYNQTCCITKCKVWAVLEAAHIIPHIEETNYSVTNGLLLRADVHTLYDLNLIGIDESGTVHISSSLRSTEYRQYEGVCLGEKLPKVMADNLGQRFAMFKNHG